MVEHSGPCCKEGSTVRNPVLRECNYAPKSDLMCRYWWLNCIETMRAKSPVLVPKHPAQTSSISAAMEVQLSKRTIYTACFQGWNHLWSDGGLVGNCRCSPEKYSFDQGPAQRTSRRPRSWCGNQSFERVSKITSKPMLGFQGAGFATLTFSSLQVHLASGSNLCVFSYSGGGRYTSRVTGSSKTEGCVATLSRSIRCFWKIFCLKLREAWWSLQWSSRGKGFSTAVGESERDLKSIVSTASKVLTRVLLNQKIRHRARGCVYLSYSRRAWWIRGRKADMMPVAAMKLKRQTYFCSWFCSWLIRHVIWYVLDTKALVSW